MTDRLARRVVALLLELRAVKAAYETKAPAPEIERRMMALALLAEDLELEMEDN